MIKIKYNIIFFAVVLVAFAPFSTFAASMSSENYSVPSGIIGPGVVGVSASANYAVEYSQGDEATYTTAVCNDNVDNDGDGLIDYPNDPGCSSTSDTDETDAETPGGVGLVGISGAGSIPSHINAFNVPLSIMPEQSGTLLRNVTTGEIIVDVPRNNISSKVTFSIIEELLSSSNKGLISVNTSLINGAFYDVTAKDQDGNPVTSFPQFITISLPIPEALINARDLGVYWFDESSVLFAEDHNSSRSNLSQGISGGGGDVGGDSLFAEDHNSSRSNLSQRVGGGDAGGAWVLIQDTVFDLVNSKAVFQVDHLTKFAVFSAVGQPERLPVLPQNISILAAVGDFFAGLVTPEKRNEPDVTEIIETTETIKIVKSQDESRQNIETKKETKLLWWIFVLVILALTGATAIYMIVLKRREKKDDQVYSGSRE